MRHVGKECTLCPVCIFRSTDSLGKCLVHFFIRSTIRHNKDIFLFSIYHTAYGDNMKPAVFPCFLMQRFKIPFFLFLIPDFLQIILLCIFCLFRIKFSQNTNIFTDLFYGNSQ